MYKCLLYITDAIGTKPIIETRWHFRVTKISVPFKVFVTFKFQCE